MAEGETPPDGPSHGAVRDAFVPPVQEALLHESNRALVQLASGHSSEAILGYAHIPSERRFHLSQKLVASLAANH